MLATPLRVPTTFLDLLSKIEGVIPEHRNVCHDNYYKILGFVCTYASSVLNGVNGGEPLRQLLLNM